MLARVKNAENEVRLLRRELTALRSVVHSVFTGMQSALSGKSTAADGQPSAPTDSRTAAVWESWKEKFGGGTAKVIDALLLHKMMDTTQLTIATGLHRTSIPAIIYKLNQASLINKNGGKFSLKEL